MIEPDADLDGSACSTAVTVAVAATLGATYSPVSVTVPSVAFPPSIPFTFQVTAVSVIPVTVAVNCCAAPAATFTFDGAPETTASAAPQLTVMSVMLAAATTPLPFTTVQA